MAAVAAAAAVAVLVPVLAGAVHDRTGGQPATGTNQADPLSFFLDRARTLGDRLGPILFQCPPSLRYDRALIEGFVGYLPPTARYAMYIDNRPAA